METVNTSDIQDIQDRIGYVDTGPSQQQANKTSDIIHPTVVTSSTSHLTVKEPKPVRKTHNLNDVVKNRNSGFNNNKLPPLPEMDNNNNKTTYHHHPPPQQPPQQQPLPQQPLPQQSLPQQPLPQQPKPIIKKSNSMETGNYRLNVPSYYNDSNKRSPTDNKTPFMNYQSTSSAPMMTSTNNEGIERVVQKLYELAELVQSLNIDEQQQQQQVFDNRPYYQQQGPRPTASKSDPMYQPQPIRRNNSGRKKYIPTSPETNRQQYNKSADNMYARPYYDEEYNYYPYYEYDDYRGNEYLDEPYQYAQPPPPPPPQQRPMYNRPRRKSYNNLRDEEILQQQRLSRKNSRGNVNNSRHVRQPQMIYDPYIQPQPQPEPMPTRYHYYAPPPPHPQYSPDATYYHH